MRKDQGTEPTKSGVEGLGETRLPAFRDAMGVGEYSWLDSKPKSARAGDLRSAQETVGLSGNLWEPSGNPSGQPAGSVRTRGGDCLR